MRRVRFKKIHWMLIAIISISSLMYICGCEKTNEFNADELFSLEDMPEDYDYALSLIDMMDRWRTNIDFVASKLGAKIESVPYSEIIPEGWSQYEFAVSYSDSITWTDPNVVEEIPGAEASFDDQYELLMSDQQFAHSVLVSSTMIDTIYSYGDTLFSHYYSKTYNTWYEEYYFKSFQDANVEFLRFDFGLEDDSDISPRQIQYQNYERLSTTDLNIPQIDTGDSMVVRYSDNLQNISELEAEGMYSNMRIVYWTQGSGLISRSAGLFNVWNATVTGLSPVPGDPRGIFEITGQSSVNDLENFVTLNIVANVTLRPNSTGEASIKVNGVERARITFEEYDTEFHGYFRMNDDNWSRKLNF